MLESDDRDEKPRRGTFPLLVVISLALGGLTCWVFHLAPLPPLLTGGHSRDPGWLVNLALGYFVLGLVVLEMLKRMRRK